MTKHRTGVVAVCPTCGNYPMIATEEYRVLKNAMLDILALVSQGCDLRHIELTPENRDKLLACNCSWAEKVDNE